MDQVSPSWINTDTNGELAKALMTPLQGLAYNPSSPADYAMQLDSIAKSLTPPPAMASFLKMSTMPSTFYNSGIMQEPGIPFEALGKIARENLSPNLIFITRVGDVMRYSQVSDQPWKPGWRIETRSTTKTNTIADIGNIMDAQRFLMNTNIESTWDDARKRDELGFTDFTRFLCALVRNTLIYDGMAIWTDIDNAGRVKAFKVLSAMNIRLCQKGGYLGNEKIYAVGVDEAGNVIEQFTRENLIWYVRNPRPEADIGGYGYSELEIGARLIQGFSNALDLNVNTFEQNSIPNGILLLKGNIWTERQLDALSRIWTNLKKGVTKAWALPVINVPKDSDIELLDLEKVKGMEAFYQDFMNMVIGALCTLYQMPPSRLGYRISGKGPDSKVPGEVLNAGTETDEYDIGRIALLNHLENVINQYIISTRWPDLVFRFTGKTPAEDAREYQARILSMTVDEKRLASNLAPLNTTVEEKLSALKGNDLLTEEDKKEIFKDLFKVLTIMGSVPTDPGLAGVFQNLVSAFFGQANDAKEGARISTPEDPAKFEADGHTAGVRRDSSSEKKNAEKKK